MEAWLDSPAVRELRDACQSLMVLRCAVTQADSHATCDGDILGILRVQHQSSKQLQRVEAGCLTTPYYCVSSLSSSKAGVDFLTLMTALQ